MVGVPKDDAQAVQWYRKAAEQGLAAAQYSLGLRYEKGLGVPNVYTLAEEWYRKAAEQGNTEAKEKLRNISAARSTQEIQWKMYKIMFIIGVIAIIFAIIMIASITTPIRR